LGETKSVSLKRLAQQLDHVGARAPGVEFDPAATGLVKAGQAVEHGGFASAVRADQGEDRVTLDLEADIAQGLDPAKVHHQLVDREHHVVFSMDKSFMAQPPCVV
jgi:hypothetical protein